MFSVLRSISSFLEWALQQQSGLPVVAHYLDDFLFVAARVSDKYRRQLRTFMVLTDQWSVPMAHEKTEGPSLVLTFVGIELYTTVQSSCLL